MSPACLQRLLLLLICTGFAPMEGVDPVYVEQDGLVVMEAEQPLLANPGLKTQFELRTELSGHSGAGYLYWNGGNRYGGADANDVLRFRILISTPGRYTLYFHVSSKGAERHDLNNDCWLKMDDGKWYKTFQASTEGWKWGGRFDHHPDGKPEAHYDLSAGEHILYLSGRSQGFHIDRIHLCLEHRKGDVRSLSLKQTNGIPVPPASLSNEKVKLAWLGGQLGAVWAWADKSKDDNTDICSALQECFDQQFADIKSTFNSDPVNAWQSLTVMTERWNGAPKEVNKQLKDLSKQWKKDKRLKEEMKAQSIIAKLQELRQTSTDEAAIAKGESILSKDYADTTVAQRYFQQHQ